MAEERVQRRFAALDTDVAGYVRLMGQTEEGIPSRQTAMNGHASDRYSIVLLRWLGGDIMEISAVITSARAEA